MERHHNTTMAFTRTAWNIAHTVNAHTTVALSQRQTKTEIYDDVGRRRRRHKKTKTDALWQRRNLIPWPPPMWLADSRAHGRCSSLCNPMSNRTGPVASFLNLLSVKRIAKERRLGEFKWPKKCHENSGGYALCLLYTVMCAILRVVAYFLSVNLLHTYTLSLWLYEWHIFLWRNK